ncbi:hypothetical protein Tco_0280251 [Tanacetum coccineum]
MHFSISLSCILCCDYQFSFASSVFALSGCDRLVSELGTGGRVGRGARRTKEPVRRNNETIGKLDGQENDRGVKANGGVGGVPNFSTVIAQQLQNLLPTLLAQVGNQGSNQGNDRNQNGDAVNDNIQGDVRNVIMNNDQRGCTYKKFLACNLKQFDSKGGAIVYTR